MQLITNHSPCIVKGARIRLIWIMRAVTRECSTKIDKISRAL